jgi:hypothetical protein
MSTGDKFPQTSEDVQAIYEANESQILASIEKGEAAVASGVPYSTLDMVLEQAAQAEFDQ